MTVYRPVDENRNTPGMDIKSYLLSFKNKSNWAVSEYNNVVSLSSKNGMDVEILLIGISQPFKISVENWRDYSDSIDIDNSTLSVAISYESGETTSLRIPISVIQSIHIR